MSTSSNTASHDTPSVHNDASQRSVFATTHWSVVLTAGRTDTTRAHAALETLCRTYWYPLYAYARRRGHSAEDAQDLTQEFFARLIEGPFLSAADPGRGRFRSFILTAMNHFLADEWKRVSAKKRGGGQSLISLDLAAAEERFDLEPAYDSTPDRIFERQWALTLLDKVLDRLEQEYESAGKKDLFHALKQTLMGERDTQPYAGLAATLRVTENYVKVTVHRLRKRYRELIRSEIAQTVEGSMDVEDEIRHLFNVLSES